MKIKKITSGAIIFNNGWQLRHYHRQDCCERVWADFKYALQYNLLGYDKNKTIFDIEWDTFSLDKNIELVQDYGFLIKYSAGGIFIPCYNENNGYYSDELELRLYYPKYNDEIDEENFNYERKDISRACKEV